MADRTNLQKLLEIAREHKMSGSDREQQRRSFVYGNTHIENDLVTRKMVDEAAERISRERR